MRRVHQATECRTGPTDWATLGTRIIQAAAAAAAVHMAERLRVLPEAGDEGSPFEPSAAARPNLRIAGGQSTVEPE